MYKMGNHSHGSADEGLGLGGAQLWHRRITSKSRTITERIVVPPGLTDTLLWERRPEWKPTVRTAAVAVATD